MFNKLRKALKKVNQPQTGWLDVFPAVIGKEDGTILTGVAGEIYVRNLLNGQTLSVHNSVAPNIATLQVEVGRRVEQPGLWQIKGIRESFSSPAASGFVEYHFEQHVFPNADSGLFPRKQLREFTVLVADAEAFIVQVYGGQPRTATGMALINNQQIDLSAYIPTVGAVYVNIESDANGLLNVHVGTGFAAADQATAADIPIPVSGKRRLATIILFESMTALLNEHILVPQPLEPDFAGLEMGAQIHAADEETTLNAADELGYWNSVTEELSKITWESLMALIDALAVPTTRWEPLANGDPSDPQLVFDGEGNVIMTEVEI